MGTKWNKIPGFEAYEVSDSGLIRSVDRVDNVGKTLKGQIIKSHNNSGTTHQNVKLSVKGVVFTRQVHRLVAVQFVPPGNSKQVYVNHKDGNPKNNSYINLEWVTHKENMQHAYATGLIGKWKQQILQYDLNGILVGTYENARDAAKITGISRTGIMKNLKKEDPMDKYNFNFKKGTYECKKHIK